MRKLKQQFKKITTDYLIVGVGNKMIYKNKNVPTITDFSTLLTLYVAFSLSLVILDRYTIVACDSVSDSHVIQDLSGVRYSLGKTKKKDLFFSLSVGQLIDYQLIIPALACSSE